MFHPRKKATLASPRFAPNVKIAKWKERRPLSSLYKRKSTMEMICKFLKRSALLHLTLTLLASIVLPHKMLLCDHSNESYWAVLSSGTVYYAVQGGFNFWVCGWNPMVWPFKWKLRSSTFLWYCLLCCTRLPLLFCNLSRLWSLHWGESRSSVKQSTPVPPVSPVSPCVPLCPLVSLCPRCPRVSLCDPQLILQIICLHF